MTWITGGHPIPPSGKAKQGSIALHAIRSVCLWTRMGSWAQLKNMPPPDENMEEDKIRGCQGRERRGEEDQEEQEEQANEERQVPNCSALI